ncbi:competence protein CoiA [Limosilactobacillus sp.]|uniref:competence protein CoiA n=1 Tax=Limosilactobacillus sp. TaxID=2773925 RepID=UPI0025BC8469|nr:competence protein CoiA family protein [Limosilactobacillus sp.]MCH3922471.1 competence protein CoiA [Limosilactobacillus sp.]MCH3927153.1 competence protein CoiA [Limosilactobacillus sp.]
MLVAQGKAGLVLAADARAGESYCCPGCRETVILRRGRCKIAHFAHRPGSHCHLSEGETPEHLLGKTQLLEWAQRRGYQPRLEVYLPAIAQRPDLLLTVGTRSVALEFQCSPLSLRRLRERNAGYRQLGIPVRWLLGAPYRRNLHSQKVAQFTQLVGGEMGLLFWNTTRSCPEVDRHFARCSLISAQRRRPEEIVRLQMNRLARLQYQHPTPAIQALACRSPVLPLATCPLICHDLAPSWPLLATPPILWRLAVVKALMDLSPFHFWPRSAWYGWLEQAGPLEWLGYGCLNARQLHARFLRNFTAELVAAGILAPVATGWVLLARPRWFASPAEKLAVVRRGGLSPRFALK